MRTTVFILALALRLAAIGFTGPARVTFGDAQDYLDTARVVCNEHHFPDRSNLPFFRAPGLPIFIAAVSGCHETVFVVKAGLAVCDALTAAILASLALTLFASRRAGWIAGLMASVHPIFIAAVCDVRSEPLFMMLLTGAMALVIGASNGKAEGNANAECRMQNAENSQNRPESPLVFCILHSAFCIRFHVAVALSGVLLALAALTRPTALLCAPLFALFIARRNWRGAAVFSMAFALTMAPWVVRNYVHFHELILVNDAGGFSFWRGSHPETIALSQMPGGDAYRQAAFHFETETIARQAAIIDARVTSPGARSHEWVREGLANFRRDPPGEWRFVLTKAWLYWRPWLNPQEYGFLTVVVSGLALTLLYVAGLAGLITFSDRRLALAIVAFFVILWLAHLPYQISMRLRTPLVDPLMIVFAAGFVSRWVGRGNGKQILNVEL